MQEYEQNNQPNDQTNNLHDQTISQYQPPVGVSGIVDELVALKNYPRQLLSKFLYRFSHGYEFNYKLAENLSNEGRFKDAIIRLKINLWLKRDHFPSIYLMGVCYIALNDKLKAKQCFVRAAEINPSDAENNFMLASLDPYIVPSERQPTMMPLKIAHEYFGSISANYEMMQAQSGYRAHMFADAAVWDSLNRRRSNYEVLELGCGTGLCGTLLAEHADYLVGVDFTPTMLDYAAAKRRPSGQRIYTEIVQEDLRSYISDIKRPRFDAIVAAHVFNYVGELIWVFDGAAKALQDGGVFVFQVERYAHEGYYGLLGGYGRFGHSDTYIRNHLQRVGLHLTAADLVNVFPNYQMVQYVARKPPFDIE
jgi:predicted TPR repeat methyltransferase